MPGILELALFTGLGLRLFPPILPLPFGPSLGLEFSLTGTGASRLATFTLVRMPWDVEDARSADEEEDEDEDEDYEPPVSPPRASVRSPRAHVPSPLSQSEGPVHVEAAEEASQVYWNFTRCIVHFVPSCSLTFSHALPSVVSQPTRRNRSGLCDALEEQQIPVMPPRRYQRLIHYIRRQHLQRRTGRGPRVARAFADTPGESSDRNTSKDSLSYFTYLFLKDGCSVHRRLRKFSCCIFLIMDVIVI